MLRFGTLLVVLAASALPGQASTGITDSIVFEQRPGGLGGDWRRIVLRRSGTGTVVKDSATAPPRMVRLPEGAFGEVEGLTVVGRFALLPDTIARHPEFGRACGSDGRVVTIRTYLADRVKHVVHDLHCLWAPEILRVLEIQIPKAVGERPPNEEL